MSSDITPLDQILDTCLNGITGQGWTVEDCLAHYPTYQEALRPLLAAAVHVRRGAVIGPSPAFRQASSARLRARIRQMPRRPAGRIAPRQGLGAAPRRLAAAFVALGTVFVAAALTTGTIYAAGSALPGEPLYPLELAVEQARLDFTPAPQSALALRLELADRRLREAEQLTARGDSVHLQEALDGYNRLIADVTAMIGTSAPLSDVGALENLDTQLAMHQARLQALLSRVPQPVQAGIDRAIQASQHGQERAAQAIKEHGGGPPNGLPAGGPPTTPDAGGAANPPGGGKPDTTPGGGKPNGSPGSKGGRPADGDACVDGSALPGPAIGQAHRLAEQYHVPYETVRDLFCTGLTPQQVEAQLAGMTPSSP